MKKECSKCNTVKNVKEFYRDKSTKDGYEYTCKLCRNESRRRYKIICENCGREHEAQKKTAKFCSVECRVQSTVKEVEVKCFICNTPKNITPSQKERHLHHYCSRECQNKGYSKLYTGENSKKYNRHEVSCDYCNKPFIKKDCQIKRSDHHYCSSECRYKGHSEIYKGENHPNWNFNLTKKERILERSYPEYTKWRNDVFERDEYITQCCNDSTGGNLVAHHILNYSEHKELRTEISNGITLCKTHHKLFHDTYGYSNNNKTQLEEFINNIQKDVVFS